MEQRESSERKSLLIRVILIVIMLLLSFLATILYVFLYPKTTIILYDSDYSILYSTEVKKYSKLDSIPSPEKQGYTFLYWSYNDFGGEELNPDLEVTTDVVKLYANFEVNRYTVTYYIRYFNAELNRFDYKTDVEWCETTELDFGTEFNLPTGRDNNYNLIPELEGRLGYHFVGWTTKIVEEDDPDINKYLRTAGSKFVIDTPSNISLYAYWEKNDYEVNIHTGIEYQLDGSGNPIKDANGDYIIRNIDSADDPTNERESLIKDKLKYLNQVTELTNRYSDFKLNEKNAGVAYDEYDFKGWYLDPEYTIGLAENIVTVKVDDSGRPYYSYKVGETEKIIYAEVGSLDVDGKPIYEFDLYTKWERRSYEVSFNKNSNRSNGKIQPIRLYRLILDEEGQIAEEYGRYYDEGYYSYAGAENGGHYSRVNLESLDVVSENFRNSNNRFRLIGWTENSKANSDDAWYALWQQDPWTEDLGKLRQTGAVHYDNPIYTHSESVEKTLYAQWSQVYDIKFAYASGTNQKNFILSGIEGEWFILPDINKIREITGEEWTKVYNYFAGWTTGTSSLADKYMNKLENGDLNPDFKYTIGRKSSTLIVLWQRTPYTVKFYKNDGTETLHDTFAPVYGGNIKYYPSAPTREGYIFDGWSKTQYADGEYSRKRREAKENGVNLTTDALAYTKSSNFKVDGDATYYASWTIDYVIEYNANLGVFGANAKTSYKYSELISSSSSASDLKINMYIGKGINVSRDNYNFIGWNMKIDDSTLSEDLLKSSSTARTTFDFYEMKYHAYRASGVVVPEKDKNPIHVQPDNKIVLVAKWEPKTYAVTIYDTLANSESNRTRVDNVAFDTLYTFPKENSAGVMYDSKVGYKLEGFALNQEGTEGFKAYDPDNMPTIDAGTLTSNIRYYTIYSDKSITVEYRFTYSAEGQEYDVKYIPKDVGVTVGSVPYGATIRLPIVNGSDYDKANGNKFLFKNWYYMDGDNRVIIKSGDKILYHDEQDMLIIYAIFEVQQYSIALSFTDPYTNEKLESKAIMSVDKDSILTQEIYDSVMAIVDDMIEKYLSDYRISGTILKGYTLDGLYSLSNPFIVGKEFNPGSFSILSTTPTGMTIQTKWVPNAMEIVYKSSENAGAETRSETNLTYTSLVTLKGKDTFNYGGGLSINKWYLIDPTDSNPLTNRKFFDCSSVLVGDGLNDPYSSIHELSKYITWDESGKGTLTLYANTQQTCVVNYYRPSKLGVIELIKSVEFIYGEDLPDLLTSDEVIYDDYKFEGWYYKGEKVNVIPVSKDNYNIDLYANMTLQVIYKIIKINGNIITEEVFSSETIDIMDGYDESAGYSYLTYITIDENKVPNITSDLIPTGYTYYGLRFGENIYSLDDIASTGVNVSIKGVNIELETYYTREFTVVYTLNDSDETFDDGTTDDKTEAYIIGYDGLSTREVKMMYSASKLGYTFAGWRVKLDNGTLGDEIYPINAPITLTSLTTTVVPDFSAPDAGTIDVKIILKHGLGSNTETVELTVKNGDVYTFVNNVELNWTSNHYELDSWLASDTNPNYDAENNTFAVGDTLNIPLAILPESVYTFTGQWVERYIVNFTQPDNYLSAEYNTRTVSLKKGEKFKLVEIPVINVDGIEFLNWVYDNNGTKVNINVGDTIYVGHEQFMTNGLADGTTEYYLPAPTDGMWGYYLVGNWTTKTFSVKLHITDPANQNTIIRTITPEGGAVPFGTTYLDRELIPADIINAYEKTGNYGIIGWSKTQGSTAIEENILSSIQSDLEVYSVWQEKVSITFASSTGIEYLDESNNPVSSITMSGYVPNDMVDINHIVRSIYAKGYTTVYFDGDQFITYNNGANDYYQVVAFDVSWSDTNMNVLEDGSFDTIKVQSTNMTLTPIIERVYQVTYFDNVNSDGGEEITTIPTTYVRVRVNNTIDLNPENYSDVTRAGFALLGWNTNKDAENALSYDYEVTADTTLYAIWTSNRVVNFDTTIVNTNGQISSSRVIAGFRLNRINKINVDTLYSYLNDPAKSNNLLRLNSENGYSSVLNKHEAYRYNNKNFYLDGFNVTDRQGNTTFVSLEELGAIDFGSADYYSTENITVNIIFKEIYTIEYSTGNKEGVTGTLPESDYFVSLDGSRVGKLALNEEETEGIITELVLATPALVRENYDIYGWSSSITDGDISAIRYDITNVDSMTLSSIEINKIIDKLKDDNSQVYTLYADWQFKNINIYVYTIADIDGSLSEDTILKDPYPYYLASDDGKDIPFSNTAKFIYVEGNPVYLNNIDFNKQDAKIAQVRYNSTFALNPNNMTTSFNGLRLVGWSTTLYRLGTTANLEFFAFNESIIVNDDIIKNGEIKLYPVYALDTDTVSIYAVDGSAIAESESALTGTGFIDVTITTETINISADTSKDITINRFKNVIITAGEPESEYYIFDTFNGDGATSVEDPKVRIITGNTYMAGDHQHEHGVEVVFSAKKLKINITLDYVYEIIDKAQETTQFAISGFDEDTNAFAANLNVNNRTYTNKIYTISALTYTTSDISDKFTYNIKSGDNIVTLVNGSSIYVTDLTISAEKDAEGYYIADLTIEATPKMYEVTFHMSKGQIVANTILEASNNIFDVNSFAIKNNVAKVVVGSTIILPDAEDIEYLRGGRFLYFYENGDTSKTAITSKLIESDVILVESFDDNAHSIQYNYFNGQSKVVTGIPHGESHTILSIPAAENIAGYRFVSWLDTDGTEYHVGDLIEHVTRPYSLTAKYESQNITIKYIYDGNASGKSVNVSFGNDFTTLAESELDGALEYFNRYIAKWLYNGQEYPAGQKIIFNSLGYTYDAGATELVFEAIYYAKYEYEMTYVTDNVTNASSFSMEKHYALTNYQISYDGQNKTLDPNTLKYTIKSTVPEHATDMFSHYEIKYTYSLDGSNYVSYVDYIVPAGSYLIPNSVIDLINPIELGVDINTSIIYEIKPIFNSTVSNTTITYVIENPNTGDILKTDSYMVNSSIALDDTYLPVVTGYNGIENNNNVATLAIAALGIDFDITSDIDFRKYTLVGYDVTFLDISGNPTATTTVFNIGDSSNRNIRGVTGIIITAIWQENYVVYYYDATENTQKEIKEFRTYYTRGDEITLKTSEEFYTLNNPAYTVDTSVSTWLGWADSYNKSINANSDYYAFATDDMIADGDYVLYPALSKNYKFSFVTTGIDSDDLANFVIQENLDPIYIYVGINETNTIDMSSYTYANVYASYDNTKYSFVGYSDQIDGVAAYSYAFNLENINGNEISIYAIWEKKSYSISVKFEALNRKNENVAKNYELSETDALIHRHDETMDLRYTFDTDTGLYSFNYDSLTDMVNDIIRENPYFKVQDIVIGSNRITEYTNNADAVITVRFAPVYSIHYELGDATIDGYEYDENNRFIIESGVEFENEYPISNITWNGYKVKNWAYAKTENQLTTMVDVFGEDGKGIIAIDNNIDMSDDYMITLTLSYETTYTVNLYYMDSIEDILNYNDYLETNENPNDAQKQNYYKLLTSLTLNHGDLLVDFIDEDNDGILESQKCKFDTYLASNPLSIAGTVITTWEGLINVFASDLYISQGLVTINDASNQYSITLSPGDIYIVMTYTGEALVNNLYLVYEPKEHNVSFGTMAVLADGSFSAEQMNNNITYAEIAETDAQKNDNGSDETERANRRIEIRPYSHEYSNVEKSYSHLDQFYLFDSAKFVRVNQYANNTGYRFLGWKVMVPSYDTDGKITNATFRDITEVLTTKTSDGIITVSNVTSDLIIVAVFTERHVDVEITIKSTNNLGHLLDVKLATSQTSNGIYDQLSHTVTPDTTNKLATIRFTAKYGTWLSISSISSNQFSILNITDTLFIYGDNMKIALNSAIMYETMDKVKFEVTYEPKMLNLYVSTLKNINGSVYAGEITPVTYKVDNNFITTEDITNSNEIHNYYVGSTSISATFNYKVKVQYGAYIDATFATAELNNYEFSGWKYIYRDTTDNKYKLADIPASGLEVYSEEGIYLIALYSPKQVKVQYFIENEDALVEIKGLEQYSTIGSEITLPYVIVELEDRITSGWKVNDNEILYGDADYASNSKIYIYSPNNESLRDGDDYIFKIIATTIERYYVVYSDGESTFDVEGSDYPTTIAEAKETSSVIYAENIMLENKDYYYARITSNVAQFASNIQMSASKNFYASNTIVIPDHTIGMKSGATLVAFDGWMTLSQTRYENNDTYQYRWGDVKAGVITLYAINSNYIEIIFHITNPTNTNSDLLLSEEVSGAANISTISALVDMTDINKILIQDLSQSNDSVVTWRLSDSTFKNYFLVNALGEKTITDDYRFYGWSSTRYTSFSDADQIQDKDNVICFYDANHLKYSAYQYVYQDLQNLINDNKANPFHLYSVWENKYEVKFTNNGTEIQSGMYAKGEVIDAPNPTTHPGITKEKNKWMGWTSVQDQNEYYFDNNTLSIRFIGGKNVEYTPIWKTGHKLTIHTNFDSIRSNVANIMDTYTASGSATDLLNAIGYPAYTGSSELVTTIDNLRFSFGDMWSEDEILDISGISFSDEGIYPEDLYPVNYIQWLDSYYSFKGLSREPNGTLLSLEELSEFRFAEEDEDITLYAIWAPIEITLYMYQNRDNANLQDNSYTATYKITFGDRLGDPNINNALRDIANDSFAKSNKRFNKWMAAYSADDVHNNVFDKVIYEQNAPIVNSLYLYPVYDNEYTIRFLNDAGVALDNPSDRQKVIAGEVIEIQSKVKTIFPNTTFISSVKYFNISMGDYVSLSHISDGKIVIDSGLTFNPNIVHVVDDIYVNIYISIEATVKLNIPNPTDDGNILYNEFKTSIQNTNVVFNGITFNTEYSLDTSIYSSANAPTIEGWYFSNVSQVDAFNNGYKVNRFQIVTTATGYAININDGEYVLDLNSITINLYAKIVVETTVTLAEDEFMWRYVHFTYDIDAAYAKHINIVKQATRDRGTKLKSITYTTIYNSVYHPTFKFVMEGYNVTEISNLDGIITADNLYKTAFTSNNTNEDSSEAILTRSTKTDNNKLISTYTLAFSSIRANKQVLRLSIEIVKVNITYTYNTIEAILRYKESGLYGNTPQDYLPSGSHGTDVAKYYNNGEECEVASLNYEVTTEGEIKHINYVNVPYGAKLYVFDYPANEIMTHFVQWNATWTSVDDGDPTATTSSISRGIDNIQYYPIEISNNNLVREYEIHADFAYNSISGFYLYLDIENVDDTAWAEVLKNPAEGVTITSTIENGKTKYRVSWCLDETSNIKAGDSLTSIIAKWNEEYHNKFDEKFETYETQNGLNLYQILQYFWFEDITPWETDVNSEYEATNEGAGTNKGYLDKANDNTIYSYDNQYVHLSKNLSRAVIVEMTHRTLDYTTSEVIDNIDRANIELNDYSKGYVFLNNNGNYTTSTTGTYNNIRIKAPFEGSIEATVTPDGATSEHSKYLLYSWNFIDNAGDDGAGYINESEAKVRITFASNLYGCFASNISMGANTISVPELRLRADVVAETHKVNFINTSNNQTISSIEIAYDNAISKLSDKYYYAYTLDQLNTVSSKHRMPRYILMSGAKDYSWITFAHQSDVDRSATDYGDYQYIFYGWGDDSIDTHANALVTTDNSVLRNSEYSDINLYTIFDEAETIKISTYTNDPVVENTYTLYLMQKDYRDKFGTTYNDDSLNKEKVKSFVANNTGVTSTNGFEYYTDINAAPVITLQELLSRGLTEFNVYPKIAIDLKIMKHNADDRYKDLFDLYTFNTLGGKLDLSMLTTDDFESGHFKGYLLVGNILADQENVIAFESYPEYVFSYWNTNIGKIVDQNCLSFAKNTNPEQVIITACYNPRFKLLSTTKGSVTLNGQNLYLNEYVSIIDTVPSLLEMMGGNVTFEYSERIKTADGYDVATILIKRENTILHTIKFTPNVKNVDNVIFKLTTQSKDIVILTDVGDIHEVHDNQGYINIEPSVYPANVNIEIKDFAITNLPDQYTNAYSYSGRSIVVSGGSAFIIDTTRMKYGDQNTLQFKNLEEEMIAQNIVARPVNYTVSSLVDYLENFRWQVQIGGQWFDIESGVLRADLNEGQTKMTIRLVADWITTKVTFGKLSSLSTEDIGGTDEITINGKDFSLTSGHYSGGLEYTNYVIRYKEGTDAEKEVNSYEYTMFKGETLEYDYSTMTFSINTSVKGRKNQTIKIYDIGSEGVMGEVQGWLQLSNRLTGMTESNEIVLNYDDSIPAYFYAWVEQQITINLNIDKSMTDKNGNPVVPGYGDVSYNVIHPLKTAQMNNTTTPNFIFGVYSYSIVCGVSAYVDILANKNNDVQHNVKEIRYSEYQDHIDVNNNSTYDYKTSNNDDKVEIKFNVYELSNNNINILFDASNTKSLVYVVNSRNSIVKYNNNNTQAIYEIFGGYAFKYTTSGNVTKVEISDHFGELKYSFNINYRVNANNTSSEFYATKNYYIEKVNKFYVTNITVSNNIITTDNVSGSTIGTSEESYVSANIGKKILLKYEEYVHTIDVKFEVAISGGSTGALSSSTAYLTKLTSGAKASYAISKSNSKATLQYNIDNGGIDISISSDYTDTIITHPDYKLVSASLYSDSRNVNNTTSYPEFVDQAASITGDQKTINISTDQYTLYILVTPRSESSIAFKFTLNDTDFENLDVKLIAGGQELGFGSGNSYGIDFNVDSVRNKFTLTTNRKTKVYATSENDRTYLNFYLDDKSAGGIFATISYRNTVSYSMQGVSGFFIDQSNTHLDMNSESATMSYSTSGKKIAKSNLQYDMYSYTASQEIPLGSSNAIALDVDCTIVLDARRVPVEIMVDNKYWNSNYANVITNGNSTDLDCIKANYSVDYTNSIYVAPSGLVSLDFTDTYGHDIRLGKATISIPAQYSVTPTVGASPAFGVFNTDNALYDPKLLDSNTWILIDMPYGDTNYVTVHFHEHSQDDTAFNGLMSTYNVDKNDGITLLRSTGENSVDMEQFYLYKSKATRLFRGMEVYDPTYKDYYLEYLAPNYSGYDLKVLKFYASDAVKQAKQSNQNTLLIGYTIYDGEGNLIKTINRDDFTNTSYDINLNSGDFSAKQELHIYPIFDNIRVYTITINNIPYDIDKQIGETYYILDGDKFDLDVELQGVSLWAGSPNTRGAKEKTFYTKINKVSNQNYAFMGLTTDDINVDLSLLQVTSSTLAQHKKTSSEVAGYIKSGTSHYYNIAFYPNCDVTFNQEWKKADLAVTYICKSISSSYTLKNSYKASQVEDEVIVYNMIEGMYFKPSISAPFNSSYFSISAYYDSNKDKIFTSDTVNIDTIYYYAIHGAHIMNQFLRSGEAYPAGDCYEKKYSDYQCKYCYGDTRYWGSKTGDESHDWERRNNDYSPNYSSGKVYSSSVSYNHSKVTHECSRCSEVKIDTKPCSFGSPQNSEDDTYHHYECGICGGTYLESHNWDSDLKYDWVNETQHDIITTCKDCKYEKKDREDCTYVDDPSKTNIASTCTTKGTNYYKCTYCLAVDARPVPLDKNNHANLKWTDIELATCETEGSKKYWCDNTNGQGCGVCLNTETIKALGHSMQQVDKYDTSFEYWQDAEDGESLCYYVEYKHVTVTKCSRCKAYYVYHYDDYLITYHYHEPAPEEIKLGKEDCMHCGIRIKRQKWGSSIWIPA